jgi:hypothetical protein
VVQPTIYLLVYPDEPEQPGTRRHGRSLISDKMACFGDSAVLGGAGRFCLPSLQNRGLQVRVLSPCSEKAPLRRGCLFQAAKPSNETSHRPAHDGARTTCQAIAPSSGVLFGFALLFPSRVPLDASRPERIDNHREHG